MRIHKVVNIHNKKKKGEKYWKKSGESAKPYNKPISIPCHSFQKNHPEQNRMSVPLRKKISLLCGNLLLWREKEYIFWEQMWRLFKQPDRSDFQRSPPTHPILWVYDSLYHLIPCFYHFLLKHYKTLKKHKKEKLLSWKNTSQGYCKTGI